VFADGQKYLQISVFHLDCCRLCSPLFAWVGVNRDQALPRTLLLLILRLDALPDQAKSMRGLYIDCVR
jgi:hypothetical protein